MKIHVFRLMRIFHRHVKYWNANRDNLVPFLHVMYLVPIIHSSSVLYNIQSNVYRNREESTWSLLKYSYNFKPGKKYPVISSVYYCVNREK